jgi:hypothetical protein
MGVIVVVSMIAGALLLLLGQEIRSLYVLTRGPAPRPTPMPALAPVSTLAPATLEGPGGRFSLPTRGGAVVHVWLQGCSDCMPAFDAMFALERTGGLDVAVPIVNVAYGEADLAWAQAHGVARNLVLDRTGSAIVRPMGITTFTTLVIDERGAVRHVDRPDRVGYAARVQRAVQDLSY